jgi:hypothetical protein
MRTKKRGSVEFVQKGPDAPLLVRSGAGWRPAVGLRDIHEAKAMLDAAGVRCKLHYPDPATWEVWLVTLWPGPCPACCGSGNDTDPRKEPGSECPVCKGLGQADR